MFRPIVGVLSLVAALAIMVLGPAWSKRAFQRGYSSAWGEAEREQFVRRSALRLASLNGLGFVALAVAAGAALGGSAWGIAVACGAVLALLQRQRMAERIYQTTSRALAEMEGRASGEETEPTDGQS